MTDMTADVQASGRRTAMWPRQRRFARREARRLAAGLRDLGRPCPLTLVVLGATVAVSLLFILTPQIDVAVSAAFYQPGAGFPAADDPLLRGLRRSSTWVMGAVLAATLIAAFGPAAWSRVLAPADSETRRRRAICLLAAFLLGPGLLINGLLKGVWGRARPINVEVFGGDAPFAAAWRFSDGCASNCAFTSGEAASATWTAMAVLALAPTTWRAPLGTAVVLYAAALSLNRVAFGGHFLSDVVLSWLLTLLTAILAARTMRATAGVGRAPFVAPRPLTA
ncbi:phosphatase PAP2 family protein [Brevundimonas sp. VNH65]|uniref:phosphatase PAP2 family protein n=1 Tax=Brevundimonas sp. VNH65 TaxID=3400917 RepID=UPI003C0EFE99